MTDKAVTVVGDNPMQVFNPLDAEPAAFARQLVSRSENYDALAMHLRSILVPGKDFGRIHIAKKDKCPRPWECSYEQNRGHWSNYALFAAGADKVLGILGLGVHYPGEQDIMRAALTGKPIAEVIVKCEIVDHQGQVISEEMGACARKEVNDNLNNAIKRATKRARVGAVMRLPSISALFEADHLAEIEKSAASRSGNSTTARQRQPNGAHATGALLTHMPFGKHKGETFIELPDEYLEWLVMEMHDKPDIHAAAVKETERRIAASASPGARPAASESGSGELPPVESYDFDDDIPF